MGKKVTTYKFQGELHFIKKKHYMGSCICNSSTFKNEKKSSFESWSSCNFEIPNFVCFSMCLWSSCSYYDFSFEEKVKQSVFINSFLFPFGLIYGLVLRNSDKCVQEVFLSTTSMLTILSSTLTMNQSVLSVFFLILYKSCLPLSLIP